MIRLKAPLDPKNYAENEIARSKVSDIYPVLKWIGSEWNLNLHKYGDFKIAKKILINSVKNN